MINSYVGHYNYNKQSILTNAPSLIGIYYCGIVNLLGNLIPKYIGRGAGENVTIKSRLLNHINDQDLDGISFFGYCICSSIEEAVLLEASEIKRFSPPLNIVGK